MNSNRQNMFCGAVVTFALGIVYVLLAIAYPQPATAATFCGRTSECPNNMVCQDSLIPFIKVCKVKPCNRDSECPSERPDCDFGVCNTIVGSSSGTSGSGGTSGGISLGDVGETCGPYKIGGVTKSRGCKTGLQCIKGMCQRPPE